MWEKIFHSWNSTILGQDWKIEFMKSFELYHQISLKVLIKVSTFCIDKKWVKWSQGLIYAQKAVFSANRPKWGNIYQNVEDSLAKYFGLFRYFCIEWNCMVLIILNENFIKILFNFIILCFFTVSNILRQKFWTLIIFEIFELIIWKIKNSIWQLPTIV
jgi:hypothetical protein